MSGPEKKIHPGCQQGEVLWKSRAFVQIHFVPLHAVQWQWVRSKQKLLTGLQQGLRTSAESSFHSVRLMKKTSYQTRTWSCTALGFNHGQSILDGLRFRCSSEGLSPCPPVHLIELRPEPGIQLFNSAVQLL